MMMDTMPRYSKRAIKKAIEGSNGLITVVADRLGCQRSTIYRRLAKDDELRRILDDETETVLDITENKLFEQIMSGNITAIIFMLKTRGRERGYGDRLNLLIEHGMEREMETVFDKLQQLLPTELYTQVIYELGSDSQTSSAAAA